MTIIGFTHGTKADEAVQRFEIFTGSGRRREWSDEEKERIASESYGGEMSVCAVARRHGLSPGQLFTWRRLARRRQGEDSPPMFVPAVIEAAEESLARRRKIAANTAALRAAIELEIG
ncbi:IS66-like element accessory protein TnpA [Sinorhizobium meliloti]|uniref:IS66-like element accessory protein TnpA n=1 Tax=Rhizobium meliloti TaxID=382 RepID=UPI0004267896|nr:transposase [Sinorhizobium meliloti]